MDLAGGVVGGGEDELGGGGAVGERGLQGGGYGEGGGDAGDDLEGDVVLAEEGYLFAGAAEDEWVAGFEAEDGAVPLRGVLEHEGVDAGLGDAGLAAAFAYGDDEGGGAGEVEDFVGDEVVGEDDVAGLEELGGAEGEEGGVAGACSYEVDGAGCFSVRGSLDFVSGEGIGAGVFAGEGAGGAAVVAADFAGGELVEEEAAGFVEGFGGYYFAAEVAEVGEPVAGVEGELGVDLLAEALGEGG